MTQTIDALSLEDERNIAAIIVRYGTAIDTRDWTLFRSCFTADFRGDYKAFGSWNSCEEITEAMQQMHESVGPTLHRMSNIVVTAIAGAATARTYVDAILSPKQAEGSFHQGIGYYDDELVKIQGDWKIRCRRFTSVRVS
ncbi:nuclear transport factor 2 family protein [Pseudomonas sp. LB3P14]